MNAIKRFINLLKSPLIPIRLFEVEETPTTGTPTTETPTTETPTTIPDAYKGAAANIAKASAGAGGTTSLADDPLMKKYVAMSDKAQRENNKEDYEESQRIIKALNTQYNADQEPSPTDVERAANDLRNTEVRHIDLGSEDAYKKAVESTNNMVNVVKKATEKELKSYVEHVGEDLDNSNITTEQGRNTGLKYLNQLYSVITDADAYKALVSDYKKAQVLSAISGGLSAAFGVPAIDFTQKPSIKVAKEVLDDARKYLSDLNDNANKRKQELLDTEKQVATTNIAIAQKAAEDIAKMNQSNYNTKRSAEDLTNANLESQKSQEQYLLDKGTNVNKRIGEQSDYNKNWVSNSSLLRQGIFDLAKTAANVAIKY